MLELVDLARRALLLTVVVSLPVVAASALVGVLVGTFGSSVGANDPAVGHLPRLLIVAAVLAVAGPWMGGEVLSLATEIFEQH
jgi:flagellar biosynthetic protein FliQ